MSVRKGTASHALPPDAVFIELPRSDGDSSTWPTETERVVDAEGNVNYFRPYDHNEGTSINWRKSIGPRVAAKMGLPDGKTYVLKSFPTGYQLFDHNKGKATGPRHDPYLYGSTRLGKNRFRSMNEFVPHALWLASNDPSEVCACKYCSGKKSQTEISQSFGLSIKRGVNSTGSAASTPPPRQAKRRPAPYTAPPPRLPHAAVRRAPKPARPAPLPAPKQTLALDKSNDVHNALRSRDVQEIRYFRRGELVWCALNSPIYGLRNDVDAMLYWPGLVDVVTTKATTSPRKEPEQNDGDKSGSAFHDSPSKAEINWTVKQQTSYKVKLLATAHSCLLSDAQMLPYLSFAPSEALLQSLREALPEALRSDASQSLAQNPHVMSQYNPQDTSKPGLDRYKEAIAPYTLAIQIASHIATYWSPTDEWESKFTVPQPAPVQPAPAQPAPAQAADGSFATLQDAINSMGSTSNTADAGAPPSLRANERIATNTETVIQLRYQGLWWGAERIWTDELVRLKLARCQFAPQGAQAVFPPAGPSKTTQQWNVDNGIAPDDLTQGAAEKGMFMRIQGLFVADAPNPTGDGTIKECRASGMLYELVDEDWVDSETPGQPQATHASGTGSSLTQNGLSESSSSEHQAGPSTNTDGTTLLSEGDPLASTLSRPVLTDPFPLPEPPVGYKFHAILPPGNECVISLSLIAGRYYPRLFKHPLLEPVVQRALTLPPEEGGLLAHRHLWSMEGLLPGLHQSMDPEQWKESRHAMLKHADAEARSLLLQEINQQQEVAMPPSISTGPGPVGSQRDYTMDVAMGDLEPVAGPSSISAAV